jgi:iron complex outermembrane receptor protein
MVCSDGAYRVRVARSRRHRLAVHPAKPSYRSGWLKISEWRQFGGPHLVPVADDESAGGKFFTRLQGRRTCNVPAMRNRAIASPRPPVARALATLLAVALQQAPQDASANAPDDRAAQSSPGVPRSPATASAGATHRLPAVQVSATRSAREAAAVPASVSVVAVDSARLGGPGANLSEKLGAVPGLVARERQNYAQDLQVSIRGFGSRSTFGIRGIRVLQDGFPLTMPDGQGQVSNLDLGALERIEVLRGPFSTLYGNAAGGVLQAFTARGADAPGARMAAAFGDDATRRLSGNLRGLSHGTDYNLQASSLRTDGYRDHGRAERDLFNAMLRWKVGGDGELSLLANGLSSPLAQDPLGLTDAQWRADPRQAAPAALLFDTRKSLRHRMLGMDLRLGKGAQEWRLLGYGGTRDVLQFLAVPPAAQANPLSGGGVVDLGSRFAGIEGRWRWHGVVAGTPLDATVGVTADRQWQHRRGYENFDGATLGVRGALRRDQHDVVDDLDGYAQLDWRPVPRLGLLFGLRSTRVRFDSNDDYVAPGNPDDSGRRAFSAISPVAGADWQAGAQLSAFLAYGHGFETPTFDELAYRADGSAGLNLALDPSRTRSLEVGLRSRGEAALHWQAAAFRAETDDELVVATNAGGRSAFQNAGSARRQGLELALDGTVGAHWTWQAAATWLDARYQDGFLTCAGSPCPAPGVRVAAGTALPGLSRTQGFVAATWQDGGHWTATLSAQAASRILAATTSTASAPGYGTVDLELGRRWGRDAAPGLATTLRLANAFDRHAVGSVIVNEANGRYFEPAPGRTLLLVVELRTN